MQTQDAANRRKLYQQYRTINSLITQSRSHALRFFGILKLFTLANSTYLLAIHIGGIVHLDSHFVLVPKPVSFSV